MSIESPTIRLAGGSRDGYASMAEQAYHAIRDQLIMLDIAPGAPINEQALALVKKLKVTPEDNATSKALTKAASAEHAKLAKLSGAAFDKAYVANEVAYHKQVNGALKDLLIPSASNAELKDLLETGLKIFQGHEQHAEHVQSELK